MEDLGISFEDMPIDEARKLFRLGKVVSPESLAIIDRWRHRSPGYAVAVRSSGRPDALAVRMRGLARRGHILGATVKKYGDRVVLVPVGV